MAPLLSPSKFSMRCLFLAVHDSFALSKAPNIRVLLFLQLFWWCFSGPACGNDLPHKHDSCPSVCISISRLSLDYANTIPSGGCPIDGLDLELRHSERDSIKTVLIECSCGKCSSPLYVPRRRAYLQNALGVQDDRLALETAVRFNTFGGGKTY